MSSLLSDVSSLPRPRAVTFSVYSELVVYEPNSDEHVKSKTWYSSKDRHGFRQELISHVRRVSHAIEVLPLGDVMSNELPCDCLGIEALISGVGAARRSEQARRAHIAAVLSEQHRQLQEGVHDIERLSEVSKLGSDRTRTRARALAKGYASVRLD